MTAPPYNEPFHPWYDLYSVSRLDYATPEHFDVYAPQFANEIDFHCLSVICPNPKRGAKQWTYRGKMLTIGIYRDEGRATAQRPPTTTLSWTRNSTTLTITDPAKHRMRRGDLVDLYNINVPSLPKKEIIEVVDAYSFKVKVPLYGDVSGTNGAYQPSDEYNFYEQNYVFRLLPSFQLISWAQVQQFFIDSTPDSNPQVRELYNITTSTSVALPRGKSKTVNYDMPTMTKGSVDPLPLARRFGQIYDELGNPLDIQYREDGQPISSVHYDEEHLDDNQGFNSPMINPPSPDRVFVYDFYGNEINDPYRGPYFRTDLITRDLDKPAPYNNIKRATQNGVAYYPGKLYDRFGNLVIGIQENNATVIRQNLLPLKLDRFNRPAKPPIREIGRLQGF